MAQVTLRINGYAYTVGCQDGEEAASAGDGRRGRAADRKRQGGGGPSGEARMLVMASLLMADDLYEMSRAQRSSAPLPAEPKLGRRLGKLAKRAEEIALDLEHP